MWAGETVGVRELEWESESCVGGCERTGRERGERELRAWQGEGRARFTCAWSVEREA